MSPLWQNAALIVFVYATWHLLNRVFTKTALSKLPGPPRRSWISGNFHDLFKRDGWDFRSNLYKQYGGAVKVYSFFGKEMLFVTDPLALYHIFMKDQYIFDEAYVFQLLVLGKNLISSSGDEHRRMRKLLNPVFSSKHIRGLYPVFLPISRKLCETIEGEVRKGKRYIDVLRWSSRAAVEYIGQGGMGYSFDSLNADKEEHAYSDNMKRLMPMLAETAALRLLLPWAVKIGPPAFRKWVIERIPMESIKKLVQISDISGEIVQEILRAKRDALAKGDHVLAEQVGKGKDIISVLLKENMQTELPDDEVLGQMNLLMFAGYDTTTSAIAHTLEILARNPEEQERLRAEVTSAFEKHGPELNYEVLAGLQYLDAVCRETLRVYPPVYGVQRVTLTDVVLPLQNPVTTSDGQKISEIPLTKGTKIHCSIYTANRSKDIWGEDAEEWKPDRWLRPLPDSVTKARLPGVYSQMMTFIGGSRACIGFKFAELELKLVLATLLAKFRFEPGPEIFWEMNGIHTPVLAKSDDRTPQLPLKVSLVED